MASTCLLRAATAVSRSSEYYCMSDMAQKAVPEKQTCLLLVVCQWWLVSLWMDPSIGSENCALSLCA